MEFTIPVLVLAGYGYAQSFAEQCRNLELSIPNVKVNVLEYVQNGTNLTFPYTVRIRPRVSAATTDHLFRIRHAPLAHR